MLARSFTALAAATLLAATPALAQPEPLSTTVSFADLDLGSDNGRATLDRRVRNAAAAVCGPAEREMRLRVSYDSCRADAIADTNRQIASLGVGEKRIQVAARIAR